MNEHPFFETARLNYIDQDVTPETALILVRGQQSALVLASAGLPVVCKNEHFQDTSPPMLDPVEIAEHFISWPRRMDFPCFDPASLGLVVLAGDSAPAMRRLLAGWGAGEVTAAMRDEWRSPDLFFHAELNDTVVAVGRTNNRSVYHADLPAPTGGRLVRIGSPFPMPHVFVHAVARDAWLREQLRSFTMED